MTKAKTFTLSDGSTWTAAELGKKLGLTATACRYRLDQSNDVAIVTRESHTPIGHTKDKSARTFVLSDGTEMTANGVARRFNLNQSTAYARLVKGQRDVMELCKRPCENQQGNSKEYTPKDMRPKAVKDYLMERNFFHPMSRLFMTMV